MRARAGGSALRRRFGRTAGALALICLVAAAAAAFATTRWPVPWRSALGVATARAPSTAAPAPDPTGSPTPNAMLQAARALVAPSAAPARLKIPSIGVDAVVEPVELDGQGRMAAPSQASRVGWYRLGATPGDAGNAVLDGHLDWTSGPAVFWLLGRMKKGDEMVVLRADGTQAKFVTDSTAQVPYDSPSSNLFTKDGPPSLTLITCAGSWDRQRGTYLQRLVVRASLVAAAPLQKPGDEAG